MYNILYANRGEVSEKPGLYPPFRDRTVKLLCDSSLTEVNKYKHEMEL